MPDTQRRVAVQLDEGTYERIRIFAFQCRTSIPEIIRKCIDTQLDKVELAVIPEVKGKMRQWVKPEDRTLEGLRMNKAAKPGKSK